MKKINFKDITVNDRISFIGLDKSLGRAEFLFCPVYVRGKLKTLFIQALQQECKGAWRLDCEIPVVHFHIESWTHKTEHPKVWRESWCLDHKTIAHEVYVPPETDEIVFSYFFGNSLSIRFQKKGDT